MREILTTANYDPVNRPAHYNQGQVECIDAIKAALGAEQYVGFLRGQVMKYLWRCPHKGASLEDVRKSRWYLDRLIRELEGPGGGNE